jgi:hypothetical protein
VDGLIMSDKLLLAHPRAPTEDGDPLHE